MSDREKGINLMERYLHGVGEELPTAQREDVVAELRSLLTEQLDERVAAGESSEGAAVELLQSFGKPGDVAMRYAPQGQYLIGPHVYPYFIHFARITFYLVVGMFVFWSLFALLTGNTRLPEFFRPGSLIQWFVELVKLLAINMAVMVVVFAVLERVYKPGDPAAKKQAKAWDPRDLPEVPVAASNPDKISEPAIIGKIYAIVALAVLLNFFPHWFGVLIFSNKGTLAIPYTAFGIFLPVMLLNVWWAGALALNVWLLSLRRWTTEARWVELALNVLGAGILFIVISASSFAVDAGYLAEQGGSAPERLMRLAERSLPWSGTLIRFVLSMILLGSVIEALMRLWRILRRSPAA